jgi:hypothetical protein
MNEVYYERVENTIDQIRFYSNSPMLNVYLDHPDVNVQYKFMIWTISEDKKSILIYDDGVNLPIYNVIIEMVNGEKYKFEIENLNNKSF